jgi:hypothetical protein
MTARSGQTPATTVLYIGGSGRSGSTLLECLLARLDNVVVLGEVQHLWQRGVRENQLCACGERFDACPFWREVGDRAFGGWDQVDVDRVMELMEQVDRQRRMVRTARRHPSARTAEAAREYSDYYRRIYDAARALTGAQVVVDSNKVPPTALCLSHNQDIDLRVLHLVRDSRGVAYSWTKTVARPETETGEPMPRLGVSRSTGLWLSHNVSISGLAYRGVPVTRIRYEELVQDAAGVVRAAWSRLGLPGDGELPMVDRTTIELQRTHSVAGNPMRFSLGTTTLRPDVAWRTKLPARDRRLVTALTYPVLRRMGYDPRISA